MFNHAYDIAFEVLSAKEDGSDVTPRMLREAIRARLATLNNDEMLEACSRYDTFKDIR